MSSGHVETAESLVRRAHSHCHKDNVDGLYSALSCFMEAIKMAPNSPEIFLHFGDFLHYFMNDNKRAYKCYERSYLLKPNDSEMSVAHHCAQFELLNEETSQRFLKNFIKTTLDDSSLPALRRLIIHYMYSGDILMSQRICDCAIDIDPKNFIFLMFRAELARLNGMNLSSHFKSFLKDVECLNELKFLARLMVTTSSLRSGDFEEIADSIENLINSDETSDVQIFKILHAEVMCYLGDDLLSSNRYNEAFDLYLISFDVLRSILSDTTSDNNIVLFIFGYSALRLAQLTFEEKEFDEYAKFSIRAFGQLAVTSDLSSAYFNCALAACLLWRKNGGDEVRNLAIKCCVRCITLTNGSCDAWLLLGTLCYFFEDFISSEKAFIRSLGTSRINERAIVNLSLLYYKCKAYKAAYKNVELSKNVSLCRDSEILMKILLMTCKSKSTEFSDGIYNYLLMALNSPYPSVHSLRLFADQVALKIKPRDKDVLYESRNEPSNTGISAPSSVITNDTLDEIQVHKAVDGLISYLEATPFDAMTYSLVGSLMESVGYRTANEYHRKAFKFVMGEGGSACLSDLSPADRNVVFNAIRIFPTVDERINSQFVQQLSQLPSLTVTECLNIFMAHYNFADYSMAGDILQKMPEDKTVIRLRALIMYRKGNPREALQYLKSHLCEDASRDALYLSCILKERQPDSFRDSLPGSGPQDRFIRNALKFIFDEEDDVSDFDGDFESYFPIESFNLYLECDFDVKECDLVQRLIAKCPSTPTLTTDEFYRLQTIYFLCPPF